MNYTIPAEDTLVIQLAIWKLQAHLNTNRIVTFKEFKQWISNTIYRDEANDTLQEYLKGFPKSLTHFYYKLLVWQLRLEQYELKIKKKNVRI